MGGGSSGSCVVGIALPQVYNERQPRIERANSLTTLAAWISVDSRRPSACYLVSDSKITWPTGAQWDAAQKLFVAEKSPDIFGYCGDVQFPTLALRQVVEQADRGLLFAEGASSSIRQMAISDALSAASAAYPAHGDKASTIVHFSRDGEGRDARFRLWRIDWSKTNPLSSVELALPTESVLVVSLGTGSRALVERNNDWRRVQGRTARGIFSSFCDALSGGTDPHSGGAPQLVGLYPRWNGLTFGIVFDGRRFMAGTEVQAIANVHPFEWRNDLFERVDPLSLARLQDAQPQPKPQFSRLSITAAERRND